MKKVTKRVLSGLCAFSLLSGMSFTAFAAEPTGKDISKIPAVEGKIPQPSIDEVQQVAKTMKNNFVSSLSADPNTLNETYSLVEGQDIQVDMKSRETWLLEDEIFNGTGDVSAADNMDMYIVQTTTGSAPAMKIVSDNPNLVVRLYILDMATGQASGTNIFDQAGDNAANVLADMPAGNYVLGVYSLDQSRPDGNYTLMWNRANPAGAKAIVNCDANLLNVILGYKYPVAIYCNGNEWINGLEWEEHYTLSTGTGHYGRDQSISDINVQKVNVGIFDTNKYKTNNALFLELGPDTLWTIMRSQYSNINGDVTHIMDWNDVTGTRTPRRFTAADMVFGPHYIVIDMNTNQIVDFASPYNYLWATEEITGSAAFTRTNILNQ